MNETGLATALVSGDEEAGPSISGDTGGSRLYDVLQVGDDLHDGVDRLVLVPRELFLQTGSDVLTEDVEDQSDDCRCYVFSSVQAKCAAKAWNSNRCRMCPG